jgi:type I restriction enzyme R subunit
MQARFHRAWIEATHQAMSTQALGSERVRDGLKDILLGPARLYEALRARSGAPAPG